jgi:peptidoglycan/LPS O-acetylase OafA/YrhL
VIFGVAFALLPKGRIAAALVLSVIGALVLLAFSEYTISTSSEFGLFRCMYGFFAGYVLYRIVIAYGSPLRNTASASFAELGSVVAVVAFVSICADTPSRMFAPFVFAAAIWVFAAERGVFSRLLQCRPLVIVGLLSYSIYMSHMMIITAGNNALHVATRLVNRSTAGSWEGLLSNEWVLDAMVVGFVMTIIGVSWCTYNFIEVPWRRRFNRRPTGYRRSERSSRSECRCTIWRARRSRCRPPSRRASAIVFNDHIISSHERDRPLRSSR